MNVLLRKISNIPSKIQGLYRQWNYSRKFKKCGKNLSAGESLLLHGSERIEVGDNVTLGCHTWLAGISWTGLSTCKLTIGDRTAIGRFNHIYATSGIIIENDVLTADNVYITDNIHQYTDINTPIKNQPVKQLKEVVIGEGCWIGEHVAIIGASVGKHSVVGANAVVTHDIPDYSVAVGIPAKVIKLYNFSSKKWESL